jgi:hypothetical protein
LFYQFSVHGCIFVYMPFIVPLRRYLHRLLSAVCLVFFFLLQGKGQTHKIYISDIIHGGISVNGVCVPFAEKTVKCKISIPPGSTIKHVFLFGAEDREFPYYVPPRMMNINDSIFYLDLFTRFTGPFISAWAPIGNITYDASFMHVFDFTNQFQLSIQIQLLLKHQKFFMIHILVYLPRIPSSSSLKTPPCPKWAIPLC